MVPISATAPISALRPGLAKKAVAICLFSTTMTSAHSTRNTSIRTRKIRGEDNLLSSISIAERAAGLAGIAGISVAKSRFRPPIVHSGGGEKHREAPFWTRWAGSFRLKPGLVSGVFGEV